MATRSAKIDQKADLIWAIADKLTGVYKPHEYGDVILPLTVIRRFDCILSDTKDAVLQKYDEVKNLPMKDILLRKASKKDFYNTSKYTFERLMDDPDHIEENFREYLNKFSANVRDILEKFKFDGHITTMANKGILYIVLKEYTTDRGNLHPNEISNLEMGYIFEEIIRRFSESHNEDAGQHYTPREVIQLMVNILFYDDNDILSGNNVAKTIYDPACGTGGMLSVAEEYLHSLNASTELVSFGQEINDQTFAICKADMLIKGKRNKGFIAHIDKLRSYLDAPEEIHLGRKPEDLLETLVNMVLGSPAICIYRSNGRSTARATSLAKVFVNNFNLPESTAIIDLAYGRCRDDNSHWQNVLKYCKDGCFQAMIDEYIHMLKETAGFQSDGNQYQIVHDMMMDSLKIHTATYIADTYPDFKKRINGADRKSDGCRIRSSYAVGFTKDAGDNSKVVMRKENIRNAFNSPMRPFVLATTSIGQEGLDFHNYCRVIMHWNLPSNPIDLEQREGRINRFKCLAIRQNVADKYGKADEITFKRDIWTEMFEAAKAEKQNDQSELVPFWCFGKNQSVKIERLVPMYPMSKDEMNYERLIKILSLYRLTLGQARQEELLEYLFKEFKDTSGLKKLFIDLSPFSKGKEG